MLRIIGFAGRKGSGKTTLAQILINKGLNILPLYQFKNTEHKLEIRDDYLTVKVRNPHHEENDIEHALAAHASSIKSLSLLPASTRGCYAQMPEEGLTEDEYNQRLSQIKKIDWSRLRHSVAEPEKYCTGEACEIAIK